MTHMPSKISPTAIIALELNELCPALLTQWMGEGLLPNFKALHDQSAVFVTQADVTDPGLLEPWIQWYSLHTGLAYDQHKVFHLTEGALAGFKDIYRLLIEHGRKVGSFSSMNVAPFATDDSFFVADPWSENADANPAELNIYNRFVSYNVREYSNAANKMGMGDYLQFLSFMAQHGLRPATVSKIVRQLAAEKASSKPLSWRRVAILDGLQFDVFRSYYKQYRPDFASFFLNSVAHLQHSYWRHMDPDAFSARPGHEELDAYGDAIRTGYQMMDKLVGNFLTLAQETGATLMMMTDLSQQPFLKYEDTGGQHFHRLHNVENFLRKLGLGWEKVDPTMTHQYLARFADAEKAQAARQRIEKLRLEDGRTLFDFAPVDGHKDALYFGCQISTKTAADAIVVDGASNQSFAFSDILYQIEAIKSGRHHPDGALWIQTGQHRVFDEKPSILDILPTQLELLGVDIPADDRKGRALTPLLFA